jgi:hypothetical protein
MLRRSLLAALMAAIVLGGSWGCSDSKKGDFKFQNPTGMELKELPKPAAPGDSGAPPPPPRGKAGGAPGTQ